MNAERIFIKYITENWKDSEEYTEHDNEVQDAVEENASYILYAMLGDYLYKKVVKEFEKNLDNRFKK